MRLITEVPTLTEAVVEYIGEGEDKQKKLYLEGILSTAENVNRNGRKYPISLLEREFKRYDQEHVQNHTASGELNHPASAAINPDRISHRITEIRQEGNDFYGKALVVNTPEGNRIRAFVEAELKVGVSTRALGTVTKNEGYNLVNEDLKLICVDTVMNPSNQGSFVNGILEGIDFVLENGVLTPKELKAEEENIDDIKIGVLSAKSSELYEAKVKAFAKFLELVNRQGK